MSNTQKKETRFQVLSRRNCISFASIPHDETSVIISIVDSDDFVFPNFFKRKDNGVKAVLQLSFDDIQEYRGMEYYKKDEGLIIERLTDSENIAYETRIFQLITKKDAGKIYDFVTKWYGKVNLIIVHCNAGISRSSGVCAGIMKGLINDDIAIFGNPRFHPNTLCYKLVLEEFMNHKNNDSGSNSSEL